MSSSSRKKSRILFGKILSLLFLVAVGLFLFLMLYLRFFLPQEKIKTFTERNLSQTFDKPVTIQDLSVNPFGSIKIEKFTIGGDTGQGRSDTLFRVDKIILKYKFFSLFRRRLWITSILIDSPEFYLLPGSNPPARLDSASTGEKKALPETDKKTTAASPLPFTLLLSSFKLNDFTFSVLRNRDGEKTMLSLQGLHLNMSKVNLPRNFQKYKQGIRGNIQLYTKNGRLTISSNHENHQFITEVVIAGTYQTATRWNLVGSIKVGKEAWDQDLWPDISIDVEGRNFTDILSINTVSLKMGTKNLIDLSGTIVNFERFDLALNSSSIDLKSTIRNYNKIFSDFRLKVPADVKVSGILKPIQGNIKGRSDSLQVDLISQLDLNQISFTRDSSYVEQGFLELGMTGLTGLEKINTINLNGKFGFDAFHFNRNDSLLYKTGGLSGTFSAALDSLMFPHKGDIHCNLDNLAEGKAELNLTWAADNTVPSSRENIAVEVELKADSLDLTYLPVALPHLTGKAGLDVTLFSRGGIKNSAELICTVDSLKYKQKLLGTGSSLLHTNVFFRIDSSRKEIVLDSCLVYLDKIISGKLLGSYKYKTGAYNFILDRAIIKNSELYTYLPESAAKKLTVTGFENIQAAVINYSDPDSLPPSYTATIGLVKTGVSVIPEQMFIDNIRGMIHLKGRGDTLSAEGELKIPSIQVPKLRSSSLVNSSVNFKGRLLSGNLISINTADIHFPTPGFRGNLEGTIKNVNNADQVNIKAAARVHFSSSDTVEIINNIMYSGSMNTSLQTETYDTNYSKLRISGNLNTESFFLKRKDNFRISNIKSSLPFSLDYDSEMKLLGTALEDSIQLKPDYKNKRILYQRLIPEIGRLTLESVKISHYLVDRIDTDVLFQHNHLQLPWINIDIFGGNVAGDLYLDLHSGKPGDFTYTIRGNANRINSAMISSIGQKKKKKSELDATFSFNGKGMDISEMIDVTGYFHIINLGSDFASNLLTSIDPSGSDRSIKMTKQLINTGWKPGIFSFELRHGYVYPSFNLHQPWFSPVRLPERLEYGRLPLSFFLKKD